MFRIATGFFTWDVYRWALVFFSAALLSWACVALCLKFCGGGLFPEKKGGVEVQAMFPAERFVTAFAKVFVLPWNDLPAGGLCGIAALFILFVIAVFTG